ncbi:MAG TPA: response regulator [Steroidobacteraceae bacterium]|nr:response regulator [Steroidobacteraceae bacterium]
MSAKRALIVDDSKSARVVLSRMLQKYSIDVDTAESAQTAIEYLVHHRPDVIFMDHLMPGMDGFQALQAIKNNPRTATIPIMMYTSQEGELYVGQARALGAVGVLPKLVRPVDVSKILYQLHLLPERRDAAAPAFVAVNPLPTSERKEKPATAQASLLPADWNAQLEAALRNHDAELRRFMMATLDSYADRIEGDVRTTINETPALQQQSPESTRIHPYWWMAGVLASLLACAVLVGLYLRALDAGHRLSAEGVRLQQANAQLTRAVQRLTEAQADAERARAAEAATLPSGIGPTASAPFASKFESRIEPVPYGEPPLALGRVDALREYLASLEQQAFTGTVRVNAYRGRFCLAGNGSEGYALAPPELSLAKCDLLGNPFDQALSPAQRQSLAFANLASSVRLRTNGAINVVVNDDPSDVRVLVAYPAFGQAMTASQWNEVAMRNNRVEFTAAAAPASP